MRARYLFLGIWLLSGSWLSEAMAFTVEALSGVPGDGIPDVYYETDSGLLTLDTDGTDFVAVLVASPSFVDSAHCLLCEGDAIGPNKYTAGYIQGSSQWIRVDPLQGPGPVGRIQLGQRGGLGIADFPLGFDGTGANLWSVIFTNDDSSIVLGTDVTIIGQLTEPVDPPGPINPPVTVDPPPPVTPDPIDDAATVPFPGKGNDDDPPGDEIPPGGDVAPPTPPLVLPSPWTNPKGPKDVDADSFVTPMDALHIINALEDLAGVPLNPRATVTSYLDVNRDSFVTPMDALFVINTLNADIDVPRAALSQTVSVPAPASHTLLGIVSVVLLCHWLGGRST